MKKVAKKVVFYRGFIINIFRDDDNSVRDKYKYSWEIVAYTPNAKNRMRHFFRDNKELKMDDIFLYSNVSESFKCAKKQINSIFKFYLNTLV